MQENEGVMVEGEYRGNIKWECRWGFRGINVGMLDEYSGNICGNTGGDTEGVNGYVVEYRAYVKEI